jgi:hypothetical protein
MSSVPPSLAASAEMARRARCKFRDPDGDGEPLERPRRDCARCWVWACAVHGRCSVAEPQPGARLCLTCPDFVEKT